MLEGLNPEQLAAVTMPDESVLISAGAGSGKTRVLTTRIAWLLQTGCTSPGNILAVTFTNKAAKELLARLSALIPINPRSMWVGTFHSLCNRFLRVHHQDARLPASFQILDQADQLAAIKRILKQLNIDGDRYPPKQVQAYINSNKEEGIRSANAPAYDKHSEMLKALYTEYEAQCQQAGVVDFAELLLRCYETLLNTTALRDHYRERFRHILIDEFQDTNQLQYAWIKLLAGQENCVFAVGDDDQSIYAFRGARVDNMQDFRKDFKVKTIIKLEQNYRSHSNILDAANNLIAHNSKRIGKNLWTSAKSGEPVRIYQAYNDVAEAGFITEEIQHLHREGVALSDIALLYRSNAQSRVLEHALFSNGISYRVYGGLRFFERAEVKHALAYLRVIVNPGDDHSFLRIVNFPPRGIGARTLEQLQEAATASRCSLWDAAVMMIDADSRPTKGLTRFIELIRELQAACEQMNLKEMTELTLSQSGLIAHYQMDKEGEERLANLYELLNATVTFINEHEENTLAHFLSFASLEAGEHQANPGQDALQLMTVHAAKGLEFHTVFISGMEESLFPHEQSIYEANGLEEERRLMYVALTRARQRLYLTCAQSRMLHGQIRYGITSRFLDEIPEHVLLRINVSKESSIFPSPEAAVPASKKQAYPWSIGKTVSHSKFGHGVVIAYEGQANDLRVQVNFGRNGIKWLALEYAKLTAV